MTRVDFYILSGDSADQRLELACRLAEKALASGQQLFIHTQDSETCSRLDEKLWTFRAESFVAHRAISAGDSSFEDEPVVIAHDVEPDGSRPVLINLALDDDKPPVFFSRFERTLEIINDQPTIKSAGRNRWNFYKQHNYPLNHHKISI